MQPSNSCAFKRQLNGVKIDDGLDEIGLTRDRMRQFFDGTGERLGTTLSSGHRENLNSTKRPV